jgi:quercetin dioxygenase-like cupin family protein
LWHYGDRISILAASEETGGRFTVIEQATAREDTPPPLHRHEREDQAWYVLWGTVRFFVGDTQWDVSAGAFVYGPSGVPHAHQVISDEAVMLVLTLPGGLERFWIESGVPVDTPDLPPDASGPLDPDTKRSMLRGYGVEVIQLVATPPTAAPGRR